MTAIEVINAFTLGARGALLKDTNLSVLYESLKAVAEGAYRVGDGRATDVVDALDRVRERLLPATAGALTTRDLQVIAALVDGATNRDIALRLNVSADTVRPRSDGSGLTGYAHPTDKQRARDAGCNAVLVKPCLPEHLLLQLQRLLPSHFRAIA